MCKDREETSIQSTLFEDVQILGVGLEIGYFGWDFCAFLDISRNVLVKHVQGNGGSPKSIIYYYNVLRLLIK
jgi:hypothetical protein